MSFETQGIIHKIFDTENKSDTFKTREFVIKQEGNYPQFIKFQLTQDRCDIVSRFKEGDNVKVAFDLRGREWNEKYFTNLNAWKIDAHSQESAPAPEPTPAFEQMTEPVNSTQGNGAMAEDFDDLPF
jgi:translation initiation factor IF-3